MGRKGPSGLSLFLTLAVLFLLQNCRNQPLEPVDPESLFSVTGDQISRKLAIYSGRDRVGEMEATLRNGEWADGAHGTELTQNIRLRVSFRGDRFSLISDQAAWMDDDLNLLGLRETMGFGAGKWETRAILGEDDRYDVVHSTFGKERRETLKIPPGTVASQVLPLYLHRSRVEEGRSTQLSIFNISLGQEVPFTFIDRGLTDEGRLFEVKYWGMGERIWLDERGMVTREEMALGVEARSPEDRDEGTPAYLALESVLTRTAVPAVNIPADLGGREEAQLILEGSFKTPPSGTWQKVTREGDRARVVLVKPVLPPPDERRTDKAMMPPDEMALDLDSPRIRELASEVTTGLKDPWEKALAIGSWVNHRLGKSMKECFTALQVLQTGEGECQSHSLLTVALCRAAGVPARFAYGVVYMPAGNAYFFHTWVEVHIGKWIPIDPTLGDFPSGVDHLTLSVGGYRDQFAVFPYIMGEGGWRISMADTQ